mgnify:CR=1 FL=1
MDAINSQVTKALIKQKSKSTSSDVEIQELLILQLKNAVSSMKAKVEAYESQYSTVAKVKLEKRLKEGVDGKRAEEYQKQVDHSTTKKETMEITWDTKIEALENEKTLAISSYERKIEEFQEKIKAAEILYNSKLTTAKAKKTEALTLVQKTIDTFTGYVNKYYEDVQPELTVQYPPAYYKHAKELEDTNRELKSAEHLLLVIKAAGYTPSKSPADIAREKERARIIAEEKAEAIEAEYRQREQAMAEAIARKAAFKAEEERIKERARERAKTSSVVNYNKEEEAKKVAIRLAQLKATEEYRSANGVEDLNIYNEESDTDTANNKDDDKDDDLLEDYKWATEKGLPVPEAILKKLKDRNLI